MTNVSSTSPASGPSSPSFDTGNNDDLENGKKAAMRKLKKREIENEIMTKELENISKLRF
ncbi:hypothetical protein [Pseudomonas gessardii]|uniref:Uncharacterized protein n=1 Tax=Pseudomonas gessardii TaxID=78544 RepID=A0A7Y1MUP7_9PSED|nr:hypothetical protein [Pseudomonas gessardii]NNA98754.1 hypothetical protein [Pseudomonas gessardii]